MRPEHLTLAVRPRHPFEAADLGVSLMQTHGRGVYRVWLAFLVPVTVLALSLEHALVQPLALLMLWWLKPLFDHAVLWVLSRAVFGESMTVSGVLSALPVFLRRGLPGALLWRRPSLSRGFLMPVRLLEELQGKALSDRITLMQRQHTGRARWLLQIFAAAELAILLGLISLTAWLTPAFQEFQGLDDFLAATAGDWRRDLLVLFYALTISLVEPFYVAASFLLYLNRRTDLEAWDIEIAFRRLADRLNRPGDGS